MGNGVPRHRRQIGCLLLLIGLLLPARLWAAPPYNTDQAEVIGYGRTEIDAFMVYGRSAGYSSATAPGIEVDYGLLPRTQVRISLPLAYAGPYAQTSHFGLGDAEFGVKYQVLDQDGWWPTVSIGSAFLVPIGSTNKGLGQGGPSFAFPIWLQERFGRWSIYGGGGITVTDYKNGRNFPFAGLTVQRQFTDSLALNLEVFHAGPGRVNGLPNTTLAIGSTYDFSATYHLYVTVGRGVQNAPQTNLGSLYVALAITF